MSEYKNDYIKYRIKKSEQTFCDAKILSENGSRNAAVKRFYYAYYYIVSALTLNNDIKSETHSGLKSQFTFH